jgi:hypothetical protein
MTARSFGAVRSVLLTMTMAQPYDAVSVAIEVTNVTFD